MTAEHGVPPPGQSPPSAPQPPSSPPSAPSPPAPSPPARPPRLARRPVRPPASPPAASPPASPRPGAPQLTRPSAVLDDAHVGDIEGALGHIRLDDTQRSGLRRRLITFLAIIGPGLIVMVGDNDAGGVSTYAQAGQDYGYSLLWTLLLLIPVLIVNQEMVVRLGAVTGVGHARLINERFGRFWGWFSVGDLFVLNFLTIVTEFIGVRLALEYFGVSPYISVPVAAAVLVLITATGSFRRWERAMFLFIAVSLIMFPMALLSHPSWGSIAYHFVVPGVQGGVSSNAVLLIIAIVGTTVAPWQLFFQQSNVIDKRITPRFISYERADTTFGAFVVIIGATAIMITAVFAVRGTSLAGHFTDALGVANALGQHHSRVLGAFFAIVLLDASIIGAAAVTLATSYAFGDVFGIKHSLRRTFRDAKPFYASYTAMIVVAAGIVLIPGAPLGLLTTAVQALAGILLPSASVFLLLLCNDREVLGPWVNPRWLNVLASFIIGVLVVLSGTLVVTTLFTTLNAATTAIWIAIGLVAAAAAATGAVLLADTFAAPAEGAASAGHDDRRGTDELADAAAGAAQAGRMVDRNQDGRPAPARVPRRGRAPADREGDPGRWRARRLTPPLSELPRPRWSPGRRLGMLALRGYLVVAVGLVVVKIVELSVAH